MTKREQQIGNDASNPPISPEKPAHEGAVASISRDGARYRWLRATRHKTWRGLGPLGQAAWAQLQAIEPDDDEIDAAIDAAINAEGK
jgi:hypothetical protein